MHLLRELLAGGSVLMAFPIAGQKSFFGRGSRENISMSFWLIWSSNSDWSLSTKGLIQCFLKCNLLNGRREVCWKNVFCVQEILWYSISHKIKSFPLLQDLSSLSIVMYYLLHNEFSREKLHYAMSFQEKSYRAGIS